MNLILTSSMFSLIFVGFISHSSGAEWRKHIVVPAGKGSINGVSASDFDKDGQLDVITSVDGEVIVLKGPDWKRFPVHKFVKGLARNKPRPACIHSCLMDVDGDGDMDFIGSNQTVFWLECPDNPFSGTPWKYRTVDDEILGTHCVITGDVNQDGKLDLIANSFRDPNSTKFYNSIVWLEVPKNPDEATSWIRHVFADKDAPGGSHYMGFGDVNGDGRPDIAAGAKGTQGFVRGQWFAWWEQGEDATKPWKKHLLATDEEGASNILPADFNGDGKMDYFASRGHGKGVLWFKGPKFEQIEIDPEIAYPHSLDVVDLNGDGHPDAVTCGKETDGVVKWYENDGKGKFTSHLIGKDQGSYDTRTIDMDKDGDLDVLIAGHGSKNVVWYENPLK